VGYIPWSPHTIAETPLFTFDVVSLRGIATLCTRLTESTRDAATMEAAAAEMTRCLREWFVDHEGRSDIVLAQVFQTAICDDLPCLVLLSDDGDQPESGDRRTAGEGRTVPLPHPVGNATTPTIPELAEALGITVDAFLPDSEPKLFDDLSKDFDVFFVPEVVPGKQGPTADFVADHGVRSLVGFGSGLPDGTAFLVVVYTRKPVSYQVAGMFRTVAAAAKLALLVAMGRPFSSGEDARSADALAVAAARITVLQQLLAVQQKTVVAQTTRLESALADAVASRNSAEREAEANEALREITTMLSAELDVDRLVQRATDAATHVTGASYGAFFYNVTNDDGEQFMLYTLSGTPRSAFDRFPQPRATAVFGPTFHGTEVIRSPDITADRRYGHNEPYYGTPAGHLPVRSYLAVPVISRSSEVHGGFFFAHPDVGVFDERAEVLALGIAAQAAVALDNARLYQAERSTALALQRSLLPQDVDTPDGLEVATEYLPGGGGSDVGGDWYDVIPLAGGRTAFVIGDVMGRGVSAAAIMGQLRTAIRAYTVSDLPPGVLMGHLNHLVLDMGEDLIATCVYAVLDQTENSLTFASSGHLPPALVGPSGEVRMLEYSLGAPLGVPGGVHLERQIGFPPGSRMLLFTDGLVEDRDRSLGEGLAELEEQLRNSPGRPGVVSKDLIAALQNEESQDDDITLLIFDNVGLDRQDYAGRNFPPEARAAAWVRRFVESVLMEWDDAEWLEPVVLVVNELFINAVSHAKTPVSVRLSRLPEVILVEVEDLDGHRPRRTSASSEDEHHRGLHIVEFVSSRWGSRPTDEGKVVWAEFDTTPDVTRAG
jgi:serine phosphatase RsbU (regulator of sigma subunit)/anti-sigma regulatory factor (Ser/Thr protein kinase)